MMGSSKWLRREWGIDGALTRISPLFFFLSATLLVLITCSGVSCARYNPVSASSIFTESGTFSARAVGYSPPPPPNSFAPSGSEKSTPRATWVPSKKWSKPAGLGPRPLNSTSSPSSRVSPGLSDLTSQKNHLKKILVLSHVISRFTYVTPVSDATSKCLCCFHNDHNPSMLINDGPGYYYCFSCGATGDLISFICHMTNASFPTVVSNCYDSLQQHGDPLR